MRKISLILGMLVTSMGIQAAAESPKRCQTPETYRKMILDLAEELKLLQGELYQTDGETRESLRGEIRFVRRQFLATVAEKAACADSQETKN